MSAGVRSFQTHRVWLHFVLSARIYSTATSRVRMLLSADVVRDATGMVRYQIIAGRSKGRVRDDDFVA